MHSVEHTTQHTGTSTRRRTACVYTSRSGRRCGLTPKTISCTAAADTRMSAWLMPGLSSQSASPTETLAAIKCIGLAPRWILPFRSKHKPTKLFTGGTTTTPKDGFWDLHHLLSRMKQTVLGLPRKLAYLVNFNCRGHKELLGCNYFSNNWVIFG